MKSNFSIVKLRKSLWKSSISISLLLVVLLFLIPSCFRNDTKTINIGLVIPLTTGAADFGKWAEKGAQLAIMDLNNKYKDLGFTFKAIPEDNKMEPRIGLSAFNKLVNIDKVIGVVTSGSGVVLAIAPEANKQKIPQINYAAVNPNIRDAGKYTFSLVNDANIEAKNIVDVLYSNLSIKELAILYANVSYGVSTKESIEKYYTEIGGKVLNPIAFPEDFTDIRPQIIKLKKMNPKAVYFVSNIKDAGKILKIANEMDFHPQWITYNAFESSEVLEIAGKAANGVIYTSSNLFDKPNPGEIPEKFSKNYFNVFKETPNIYSATAYDAVMLLGNAYIESKDKNNIIDILSKFKNYNGASGEISFDDHGAVNKPVFLKIVKNNQFIIYNLKNDNERK